MIAAPQGEQNTAYRFSHYFEHQNRLKCGSLDAFVGAVFDYLGVFCFIFVKFGERYLQKGRGAYIII